MFKTTKQILHFVVVVVVVGSRRKFEVFRRVIDIIGRTTQTNVFGAKVGGVEKGQN